MQSHHFGQKRTNTFPENNALTVSTPKEISKSRKAVTDGFVWRVASSYMLTPGELQV